jgi:hypothetical protein
MNLDKMREGKGCSETGTIVRFSLGRQADEKSPLILSFSPRGEGTLWLPLP